MRSWSVGEQRSSRGRSAAVAFTALCVATFAAVAAAQSSLTQFNSSEPAVSLAAGAAVCLKSQLTYCQVRALAFGRRPAAHACRNNSRAT